MEITLLITGYILVFLSGVVFDRKVITPTVVKSLHADVQWFATQEQRASADLIEAKNQIVELKKSLFKKF